MIQNNPLVEPPVTDSVERLAGEREGCHRMSELPEGRVRAQLDMHEDVQVDIYWQQPGRLMSNITHNCQFVSV